MLLLARFHTTKTPRRHCIPLESAGRPGVYAGANIPAPSRYPIMRIVGCCARAASGHAAAAPPSSVMNARRFMCPVPRYGAAFPAGLPRTQGITEGPARSLGQT
jgi:hypothetical protein